MDGGGGSGVGTGSGSGVSNGGRDFARAWGEASNPKPALAPGAAGMDAAKGGPGWATDPLCDGVGMGSITGGVGAASAAPTPFCGRGGDGVGMGVGAGPTGGSGAATAADGNGSADGMGVGLSLIHISEPTRPY